MASHSDNSTENGATTAPAGLEELLRRAKENGGGGRGLPPVEKWNPDFCGDLDMVIRRDGTWLYNGSPIGRAPLVRLFSTILRKDEDGKTYLVTPVEKVGITVEDAPFLAVEMGEDDAGRLTFRTNVGDVVTVDEDHPLRFDIHGDDEELKPYILVRGRLEALLARPVMYELVERGEEMEVGGKTMFAIRSGDQTFPIMAADELSAKAGTGA